MKFFFKFLSPYIHSLNKRNYDSLPSNVYLPREVFVVKGLDLINFAYHCPFRFVCETKRDHTLVLLMDWKISSPVFATPQGFISFE